MKLLKSNKGFTLVEIMIVMGIISLLFVLLVPQVNSSFTKARESGIKSDFRTFQLASETYLRESVGRNIQIDSLNEHLNSSHKVVYDGAIMHTNNKDPWGSYYKVEFGSRKISFASYGEEKNSSTKKYELISYYYNGTIASCTKGFHIGNIELVSLNELSSEFECGDELPAIPAPPPAPPPTPVPIPSTPTNFKVESKTSSSIRLSWNNVSGTTEYILKQDGTTVYSGSGTTYTHTGLSVNTNYNYSLLARNESGESATVSLSAKTLPNENVVKLPDEGTGSCSPYNPYIITTIGEFQGMDLDLDACFELGNDIDASSTTSWNSGKGFKPIEQIWLGSFFTGKLDGKNHTITNLTINRPSEEWVAIFNELRGDASVRNLTITNAKISGENYVAIVAGETSSTTIIENVQVSGDVMNGNNVVGGIVGLSNGMINNVVSSVKVTGYDDVGTVAGQNRGLITHATATSSAKADSYWSPGGIVGFNMGDIEESESEAMVIGDYEVGGVVGENIGEITGVTSRANVTGVASVGGVVGINYATIENSYSYATVTGENQVGGVAGDNDAFVNEITSSANVIATGISIGGVIGDNDGEVMNVIVSMDATVEGYHSVGGVIGGNFGSLKRARSEGTVNGYTEVGGVIGNNYGLGEELVSKAHVIGESYSVGGVIGFAREDSIIKRVLSESTIQAEDHVGGVIGTNLGSLQDAFSNSVVIGNSVVGGAVGSSYESSETRVASVGTVTGNSQVGGLIGSLGYDTSVTSSYYDRNTSGKNDTGKGTPKTTAEMKTQSTYIGWNFTSVWQISPSINNGYPTLRDMP